MRRRIVLALAVASNLAWLLAWIDHSVTDMYADASALESRRAAARLSIVCLDLKAGQSRGEVWAWARRLDSAAFEKDGEIVTGGLVLGFDAADRLSRVSIPDGWRETGPPFER